MMRRGVLALTLLLAGCPSSDPGKAPIAAASPTPVLPAEWAGKTNPLPADATTVDRGRALFQRNCATCHGPDGDGKGVASAGLNPAPANFRDGNRLSSKGDDYLFWRISTGIKDTAMPAFDATMSGEDRWAVLRFLRSLPGAEARATPTPSRT